MMEVGADPLHRFPMFSTSDPEELRHFAATLLKVSRIDFETANPFTVRVNLVSWARPASASAATSCRLDADQCAADFIRLQIAVKGCATASACGKITEINQRQLAITPCGVDSRAVAEPGHARLTLRLKQEALVQKLTTLLGVRPKGELSFEPAIAACEPYAQGLLRLMFFLSQQLDSTASKLPSAVYLELEQAVQIAFLWASRHNFSHALLREEKSAGVRHRRAGWRNISKRIGRRRSRSIGSSPRRALARGRFSGRSNSPAAIRRWLLPRRFVCGMPERR